MENDLEFKLHQIHNELVASIIHYLSLLFYFLEKFYFQFYFIFVGDDVKEKKPDPSIYLTAATVSRQVGFCAYMSKMMIYLVFVIIMISYTLQKLGVSGKECLVVEDSVIGLQVKLILYDDA